MNILKQRLGAAHKAYGLFLVSNGLQNAEALSHSGFHFLCLEGEHSPTSTPLVHIQLAGLASTETASMVRVTGLNSAEFKHYLDLGVDALMVPNISTADEARMAIRYTRYPSDGGVRGVGGTTRVTRYGRDKSYPSRAANDTCLVLQIESKEGLRNLDDICRIDGVDAVLFGPTDLAADLGFMGQPNHPSVSTAIENGIKRATELGVCAGVVAGEQECARFLDAGARMIVLGSDLALLVRAADSLSEKFCR